MAVNLLFYSGDPYFSGVFGTTLSSLRSGYSVISYTDCEMALEDLRTGKRRVQVVLADEFPRKGAHLPRLGGQEPLQEFPELLAEH